MKLIIFLALVTVVLAAPLDNPSNAQILKYENDYAGGDRYSFSFETSDGTSRQEHAELKNVGTEQEAIAVTGVVSWYGDDGQLYTLRYTADENGYRPEGSHLPQA